MGLFPEIELRSHLIPTQKKKKKKDKSISLGSSFKEVASDGGALRVEPHPL